VVGGYVPNPNPNPNPNPVGFSHYDYDYDYESTLTHSLISNAECRRLAGPGGIEQSNQSAKKTTRQIGISFAVTPPNLADRQE